MSAAELVPYERFEKHREKLNRLRCVRPPDSSTSGPHEEREAVAVAAIAVRCTAASEEPPQDVTD